MFGLITLHRQVIRAGLLALACVWTLAAQNPLQAQNPDDFFHQGAQLYLAEKNEQARQSVQQGLTLAPEHPQLLALEALLNQQQQQENQDNQENQDQQDQQDQQQQNQQSSDNSQSQQNQNDSSQSQENQSREQNESSQDAEKQEEQDQNQTGNQGEEQEKPENDAGQQSNPASQSDQQESPPPSSQTNAPSMIQMNPQEAMRLLDSIQGEDRTLIFLPPQIVTNRNSRNLKNW